LARPSSQCVWRKDFSFTLSFKLAADQRDAAAQYNYGNCLYDGEGVSIDLNGAAQYFKLPADQRYAAA
jgi:TPR repeat protein